MKKITLLITLVFSLTMFSSASFADWTQVGESMDGNIFYVDFERIQKVGGYVYFWELVDYLKPDADGDMSDKTYSQGDCKLFRYKWLRMFFHKEPMGGGNGEPITISEKYKDWKYPPPNSSIEHVLKRVCEYAN